MRGDGKIFDLVLIRIGWIDISPAMPLTPSQRITLRKEIARRLSAQSWAEIDIALQEFNISTEYNWEGDEFHYAAAMLQGKSDAVLLGLASHLDIKTGDDSVPLPPNFWEDGKLCVFISHLAKEKVYASKLQHELNAYGFSCFIAHEDITPDSEWQKEIEKALRTCDALVALLHHDFNKSSWTDQEVGYVLGRGAPVFSVRLGMDPYGLFGKKQAFNGFTHGRVKEVNVVAKELFLACLKHSKTQGKLSDSIIRQFVDSRSFRNADINCTHIEQLEVWKSDYKDILREAVKSNTQIRDSWSVPKRIEAVINKHDPDAPEDDEIPF